jgi:hypothetical protein
MLRCSRLIDRRLIVKIVARGIEIKTGLRVN